LKGFTAPVLLLRVKVEETKNAVIAIDLFSEKIRVAENKSELLDMYWCGQCGRAWAHAEPIDKSGKYISDLSQFWDSIEWDWDVIIDKEDWKQIEVMDNDVSVDQL